MEYNRHHQALQAWQSLPDLPPHAQLQQEQKLHSNNNNGSGDSIASVSNTHDSCSQSKEPSYEILTAGKLTISWCGCMLLSDVMS